MQIYQHHESLMGLGRQPMNSFPRIVRRQKLEVVPELVYPMNIYIYIHIHIYIYVISKLYIYISGLELR